LAFREIFANFKQGNILDGIIPLVNGKLKFLCEFGGCFLLMTNRLRNNSFNSSDSGLSGSNRNNFLLKLTSNI
jgi:hypothetical protein